MLLTQRQRFFTLRALMLAVLLMQFIPVSHALHGPFEHNSAGEHSEPDHGHDCDADAHADHQAPGSDHEHDPMPMECDCLLCQMAKAPALAPLLWLGTQSATTRTYITTETPLAAKAVPHSLPLARGPPPTASIV